MRRASLAVCALGGALLVLAGCGTLDLGFDLGGSPAGAASVRVVDGHPDFVALSLQDTLGRRGLEAKVVKSGDDVVVESKTKDGVRFALMLKREDDLMGRQKTRVSVVNSNDTQLAVELFTEFERQTGTPATAKK